MKSVKLLVDLDIPVGDYSDLMQGRERDVLNDIFEHSGTFSLGYWHRSMDRSVKHERVIPLGWNTRQLSNDIKETVIYYMGSEGFLGSVELSDVVFLNKLPGEDLLADVKRIRNE